MSKTLVARTQDELVTDRLSRIGNLIAKANIGVVKLMLDDDTCHQLWVNSSDGDTLIWVYHRRGEGHVYLSVPPGCDMRISLSHTNGEIARRCLELYRRTTQNAIATSQEAMLLSE